MRPIMIQSTGRLSQLLSSWFQISERDVKFSAIVWMLRAAAVIVSAAVMNQSTANIGNPGMVVSPEYHRRIDGLLADVYGATWVADKKSTNLWVRYLPLAE